MHVKRLALTFGLLTLVSSAWAESLYQPEVSDWFAFEPENLSEDFALGLASWNAQRAGDSGRIAASGSQLLVGGDPIKLWGLNNEYSDCMPPKPVADFRAAFYARQGFNSLRQHKFNDVPGWGGFGTKQSMVEFVPELLDRFDYFNAKLIEHGIYLNLSSNFGVKYGPDDAHRFEAHADFFDEDRGWGNRTRVSTGHGAIYLSPGLQSLHLEQLTKTLKHRNPYTGKTYAEDAGVAFVEIFNEDSVLFYSTNGKLQRSPVMRRYAGGRFAAWLKKKYRTETNWRQAWGEAAIVGDPERIDNAHLKGLIDPPNVKGDLSAESFAKGVVPWGQPWFYSQTGSSTDDPTMEALFPRMLDTMQFLIGLQDEFYDRAVAAIRDTGYEGEIIASNWQAGSMAGHYWNLLSDRRVGLIDRHNYFGGAARAGLQLKDGQPRLNQSSQLDRPGSGLLSSGLQQVIDRPFMLSEWNVVQPNEWYLEGPAIIGTYGMGLQGWDVSYIFASYQDHGFSRNLDDVKKFSIDTPPIMGLMPAIARMVRRGDVREATVQAVRPVPMQALESGDFSFQDQTTQQWDVKSFDGDKIPTETLAAARTVVDFDSAEQAEPFGLAALRKRSGLTSTTGQLYWTETEGQHNDYFTIDSPATKAFVGFAEAGDTERLGQVVIAPAPGFAAVFLTAQSPQGTLASDRTALIVVMARARNTRMTFDAKGETLKTVGKGPILLEPVQARITISDRQVRQVRVLDHDGRPTGRTVPVEGRVIDINSARDKSPYYQVVFE